MDERTAERFWAKVNKNGPIMPGMRTCCYEWTGALNGGYGWFFFSGRPVRAHRFLWLEEVGPLTADEQALHKCDNRKCVRLDHLFQGTHEVNQKDKLEKGRQSKGIQHAVRVARGARHGSRLHPERRPRGATHGRSKLSEDQARFILFLRRSGFTQADVAGQFGISKSLVGAIWSGRKWAYLQVSSCL